MRDSFCGWTDPFYRGHFLDSLLQKLSITLDQMFLRGIYSVRITSAEPLEYSTCYIVQYIERTNAAHLRNQHLKLVSLIHARVFIHICLLAILIAIIIIITNQSSERKLSTVVSNGNNKYIYVVLILTP